jgi:hypothetical protein
MNQKSDTKYSGTGLFWQKANVITFLCMKRKRKLSECIQNMKDWTTDGANMKMSDFIGYALENILKLTNRTVQRYSAKKYFDLINRFDRVNGPKCFPEGTDLRCKFLHINRVMNKASVFKIALSRTARISVCSHSG